MYKIYLTYTNLYNIIVSRKLKKRIFAMNITVSWYLVKIKGKETCIKVEHCTSDVYKAKKSMMDFYCITQTDIITSSNSEKNPWPNIPLIIFDETESQ